MNKRAMAAMQLIITSIILLVVLAAMIFMFTKYFGKETEIIGEKIDALADSDKDDVVNMFDKCPCVPGEFDGCPTETPQQSHTDDRSCFKK